MTNTNDVFIDKCKSAIVDFYNDRIAETDDGKISIDNAHSVWFCESQPSYKALLRTTIPDGKYYEFTLNCDEFCNYFKG